MVRAAVQPEPSGRRFGDRGSQLISLVLALQTVRKQRLRSQLGFAEHRIRSRARDIELRRHPYYLSRRLRLQPVAIAPEFQCADFLGGLADQVTLTDEYLVVEPAQCLALRAVGPAHDR